MSAVTVGVLEALEARAGASDRDRDAWLAERRGGITATEVAQLASGRMTRAALVDEKLGRGMPFNGNAFTRWGKEREIVIAVTLADQGFLEETRVFKAVENPRHLASPDGVRLNFDEQIELHEIKASGKDLTPGGKSFQQAGYGLQMQWQMYVIGAVRCLFVWEERLPLPDGSFAPGKLRRVWVERDDAVIAKLVEIADAALADIDMALAGEEPEIDEELDTLAVNYLTFLGRESAAKSAKEQAFKELGEKLSDRATFQQRSALASISWKRGGKATEREERSVVDVDAVKELAPERWSALVKADASVERAVKRREKAADAWAAVVAEHTTTEQVDVEVTVRKNLTVRAVKQKGMEQ